ncbi:MAG: glycosyltransferase [Candidatus Margulisbacteria bacterium]|jgi:spore maturation protein CgeB|nr:glycosyltransferase [Candidatus Margulisiibacteriota bacterium]
MKKKVLINSPRFYGIDEAIREAFEQAGFEAVLLNYGTKTTLQEKLARQLGLKLPLLKPLLNPILKYYLGKENRELLAAVRRERPDLIFIIKGDHLFPETLRKIKSATNVPVVSYIWDDPFYSYAGIFADDYRRTNFAQGMPLYDYIFVYDTYYVEQIRQKGIDRVSYLPLATDPQRYGQIKVSAAEKKEFGYDLCFVGAPHPNRVEIMESLKQYDLGVFGDGWVKYFMDQGQKVPAYYKGLAAGEKVLKLYLSSRIALNVHDPEAKEGLNTRTFDILASGASELVDYQKNLDLHFQVGEEIAAFRDKQELLKLVQSYLSNDALLKEISNKGKRRVLNEHTWFNRVNSAIKTLSEQGIWN